MRPHRPRVIGGPNVRRLVSILILVALTLAVAAPADAQRDTARVSIGTGPNATAAFVAYPSGKGAGPAVVVVHEWWGLNGQIRDVARKLAAQGYVAIVPDLYHGKVASDAEQAHILVRGLEDERVFADLDAAIARLRAEPRVGAKSRIGILGFCMGGAYTLGEALRRQDLAVAVMFYGPPETESAKLAALSAALQAHFGGADDGIPAERVEAFRTGLAKAGKSAEVFVYPTAGHAFMNETRPSYHAEAARQAWTRTVAFLQKHLKG